ncbi:MAG: hypothetical protein IPH43_04045 [Xanthomonadales bacterium]|nr:hypothetical protein [Xanthomonadales bacterium]
MKKPARIYSLADGDPQTMRFVCGLDGIKLGEGAKRTTVTITRTGVFTDPRYGRFEIRARCCCRWCATSSRAPTGRTSSLM